jgi:predicted nucleotide-binding protein
MPRNDDKEIELTANDKIARLLGLIVTKDMEQKTDKVVLSAACRFLGRGGCRHPGYHRESRQGRQSLGEEETRQAFQEVINKQLLQRIASRLGVGPARAYSVIAQKATSTGHDREIAALLVAADNGINYHKYSTAEQRAQIRGTLADGGQQQRGVESPAAVPAGRPRKNASRQKAIKKSKDNTVFVVHGRNEALRKSMFDFLRALGLKPLEWQKALQMAKGNNPFIGDVLEEVMAKAQAVVVLFSPDDEARLRTELQTKGDPATEKKLMGQARPNVLFEAGLALGKHPEKTVLVEVGKLRKFSDVAGRHVVRLTNDYAKRNDLAERLAKIGCAIDKVGDDWTKTGHFVA